MIILKGKLDAKRVGKFEGREYAVLQFIEREERNGTSSIKLIEVNLPDGADHSPFVEGKQVELTISISGSKTGKIYYRAILPAAPAAH